MTAPLSRRPSSSSLLRMTTRGPVAIGVWALVLWQLGSSLGLIDPLILPSPLSVLLTWIDMIGHAYYWQELGATVTSTLLGLIVGTIAGLLLGALIGGFRTVRRAFFPLIILNQNMPNIAIAPILLIWLGLGLEFRTVLTALICFFPILINFIAAFSDTDHDLENLMRVLGAPRWKVIAQVIVPGALPALFAGLRVGTTLALIGAIVGEFLAPGEGAGSLIVEFTSKIQVPQVFVLIFTLGILGILLYQVAVFAERRALYWQPRDTTRDLRLAGRSGI